MSKLAKIGIVTTMTVGITLAPLLVNPDGNSFSANYTEKGATTAKPAVGSMLPEDCLIKVKPLYSCRIETAYKY